MEDIKPLSTDSGVPMVSIGASNDEIALEANPGIIKRVQLPEDEKLEKAKFLELWHEQNRYLDHVEAKLKVANQPDASRREHLLIVRLTTKEQELQELSNQIAELKASQAPSTAAMRNALLDPAVNLIVQKLKKELETTRSKLQETQEELSAWKFTPDSVTGKRLMAKCRQLLQENEEIGKMISSGRLAKLEGELSMQKALCEEMKKNQIEMDDFVQELDDDMEGMQSTIYFLQQQLKEAKETIANLEAQRQGNPSMVSKDNQDNAKVICRENVDANEIGDSNIDEDISANAINITTDQAKNEDFNIESSSHKNVFNIKEGNTSETAIEKDDTAFHSSDNNLDKTSELDTSLLDESVEEKNEESELGSTEGTSESPTSLPRGRGRRGTPTKLEKPENQTKGRRGQRTTRGQKRMAPNILTDEEKDEKIGEDDGATTLRPKRTRVAPQRFVTKETAGKRKKTNSESEEQEEQEEGK